MYLLTDEQHVIVLKRLINKAKESGSTPKIHSAGIEYTSLMNCFLLHNLSCSESLIKLLNAFTIEWFPVTVGYTIVRPMFEIDLNAHYISKNPKENAKRYIDFGKVNLFNQMNAIKKHCDSNNESWKEGMNLIWENDLKNKSQRITDNYNKVIVQFSRQDKKGKLVQNQNWAGISLKQMAKEVDHEEAYDVFYSELSAFTHVNVDLANRYLHLSQNDITWTMKANDFDRSNVFRYAATFFSCFLELFGKEFNCLTADEINNSWNIKSE
jgi:hypothetical protein